MKLLSMWRCGALATMLALGGPALAAIQYEVVNIGNLPGTSNGVATAINRHNQVVGYSQEGSSVHAFLWTEAWGMTNLNPWGAQQMFAYDINDHGVVAGTVTMNHNGIKNWGYRQISSQQVHSHHRWFLTPFGDEVHSFVHGINNAGTTVGRNGAAQGHAARWDVQGVAQGLPDHPPLGSTAQAINDAGTTVGWAIDAGVARATLWTANATLLDLHGMLPDNTPSSHALDINDAGWVVGKYQRINNTKSFVWTPELGMQLVSNPFSRDSHLNAISSEGLAVGQSGQGDTARAVLWSMGTGMLDLNDLITPGQGWVLHEANDINTFGYIVGTGTLNGIPTNFMLRPVPEPGSWMLLLGGLTLVGGLIRRRAIS